MRLTLWPQSLFGRLFAASIIAVLLANAAGLVVIGRERERFILQGNVREWSRRIAEDVFMLQAVTAAERPEAVKRLIEQGAPGGHPAPPELLFRGPDDGGPPETGEPFGPHREARPHFHPSEPHHVFRQPPAPAIFIPLPGSYDFEPTLKQQLQALLGASYQISIAPTTDPTKPAIPVYGPFLEFRTEAPARLYDVDVRFPDGQITVFRVARIPHGALLPRNLFANLLWLVVVLMVALYVTARSITRPLSKLAQAADSLGRDTRQPKLEEKGARELRDAARAFNTMQDRLHRYLDSRTRVLAAMSHDLKTPLTRLRLQVETLEDPTVQARFGKELDEMENMVRGALALFRGLDDDESQTPVDINELLNTLRTEFTEMGADVAVEGRAVQPFTGKPQALKRCLTNLVANAVKFGTVARIVVEDSPAHNGPALLIRVRDAGPGIPPEELERVFEPFYRVESSRNRDTGGTGLGLSIARDVAQAHGGSVVLRNLPGGGLEALVVLPRRR